MTAAPRTRDQAPSPAPRARREARPTRRVDTLLTMEHRGSITNTMRLAGESFRTQFEVAQLDPLQAFDWSRVRSSGARIHDDAGMRTERARAAVWKALQAVGGIASPAGSCLWHVVGWEQSIREWAIHHGWNGRKVSQETASGILIATLGALEAHYTNAGTRS